MKESHQPNYLVVSGRDKTLRAFKRHVKYTCNVSFYLEMDSDYVISKSKDHLAPPFLHFCKKYDICNFNTTKWHIQLK